MQIMIVEDNLDFAEILKESLEDGGELSVARQFENAADVMAFSQTGQLKDINCILLDLQLPRSPTDRTVNGSAGLELAYAIRRTQNFCGRIIILTNSRSLSAGERALAAGCDGYVCKHVRLEETLAMVAQLKAAISGEFLPISREMQHVFLRGDLSAKEACLMSLVCSGHGWEAIAKQLGYKNPKAAANSGDRIFDKIVSPELREELNRNGFKKRQLAAEIWKGRNPVMNLTP